jgi:hypothetical protein
MTGNGKAYRFPSSLYCISVAEKREIVLSFFWNREEKQGSFSLKIFGTIHISPGSAQVCGHQRSLDFWIDRYHADSETARFQKTLEERCALRIIMGKKGLYRPAFLQTGDCSPPYTWPPSFEQPP